jgi:FKBP-type peptidyl-prolyl cis-trans isomerase FkpA
MTKISSGLIAVALLLCISCNKNDEKQTPNGLKFNVIKTGDGVLPKKEQVIVFEYFLKDSNDSTWQSSINDGIPGAMQIQDSAALPTENGLVQMFRMLSKGDSVAVNLPIVEFFKTGVNAPPPNGVDTTLGMSYNIHVTNIMAIDEFRAYQTEAMDTKAEKQVGKDASIITKYLSDNNITAQQDTSGLRYVIHTNKGGSKPSRDNCVEVKYRGKLLKNGDVFDESEKLSLPLGAVIPGWQLGMPMMGIGDSATFYIPSGLAYGPAGVPGTIPPDAILIFDVQLLGFGGQFDEATRTCK